MMKLVGRIIAIVLAALVSVFMVQRAIRRLYDSHGKKYIPLRTDQEPE